MMSEIMQSAKTRICSGPIRLFSSTSPMLIVAARRFGHRRLLGCVRAAHECHIRLCESEPAKYTRLPARVVEGSAVTAVCSESSAAEDHASYERV